MIICVHETCSYGGEQDSVYFIDTTKVNGLNQQEANFIKAINDALKDPNKMVETDAQNMPWCAGLNYLIVKLPLKVNKYVRIYYN